MAKKLFISDQRMLQLMAWAIDKGIAENEKDYLAQIGFQRTNITKVRAGTGSFTKEHILNACKLTGASADYIFGFTTEVKRTPPKKALELLKLAVVAIESEINKN